MRESLNQNIAVPFSSTPADLPLLPRSHELTASTLDADFLRHKQALASQLTMTPTEILQPATNGGVATLSHW